MAMPLLKRNCMVSSAPRYPLRMQSGRGVEALYKFLGKYNKSVKLVLLPELRHEILNEIKKEQALSKISEFLNS